MLSTVRIRNDTYLKSYGNPEGGGTGSIESEQGVRRVDLRVLSPPFLLFRFKIIRVKKKKKKRQKEEKGRMGKTRINYTRRKKGRYNKILFDVENDFGFDTRSKSVVRLKVKNTCTIVAGSNGLCVDEWWVENVSLKQSVRIE